MYEILKGKLYGSERPGAGASGETFAARAKELGVKCVVSLRKPPPPEELERALAEDNIRYVHRPVMDFTPPSEEDMKVVRKCYRESRKAGGALLVHCTAGYGRTGTAAAALLVAEESMQAREAISLVRAARPGAIETAGQEKFVLEYGGRAARKRYRKKRGK